MDWTLTHAPVLYDGSRKRSFDDIVDDETLFGPEFGPEAHLYRSERLVQSADVPQVFAPDPSNDEMEYQPDSMFTEFYWSAVIFSNLSTYEKIETCLAACGRAVDFCKRRLISRNDPAPSKPLSRRRKNRNKYPTQRQRYEQRKALSLKLRDIPGRFPDTPLSEYCRLKPQSSVKKSSPTCLIATSHVSGTLDMTGLPGRWPPSTPDTPFTDWFQRRNDGSSPSEQIRPTSNDFLTHDVKDIEFFNSKIIAPRLHIFSPRSQHKKASRVPAIKSAMYRKQRSNKFWTAFGQATEKKVKFHESPQTGRPVTRTKRFVESEAVTHPSPNTTIDESSMMSNHSTETTHHYQQMLNAQLTPQSELHSTSSTSNTRSIGVATATSNEQGDPHAVSAQEVEHGSEEQHPIVYA